MSSPTAEQELRSVETSYLLTDEQITQFIVEGYLLVKTELPLEFHQSICEQIDSLFERVGGNPQDEILEGIPDLHTVYDDPNVKGALISLLGPDYSMSGHRHCHYTKPGERGGHWHQDAVNVRHHRIVKLLGVYYPQDVTEDMGPTVILPGSQYHNTPSSQMASYMNFKSQLPMNVEVGTVAIAHYDVWHAWMNNRSEKNRRMLKFLFNRESTPTEPTWNHDAEHKFSPSPFSLPIDGQSEAYKHRVMWRTIWDWMCGEEVDDKQTKW